ACIYNDKDNIDLVKPNARPVVVYMTMENTLDETLERIYSYMHGEELKHIDKDIKDSAIMKELYSTICTPHGIDLMIIYNGDTTVNTGFMEEVYDMLEENNKEPILFVQDYLARFNSINPAS